MSVPVATYDQLQRENRRATRVLLGLGIGLIALLVWVLIGYFSPDLAFDPVAGPAVALVGSGLGLGVTFASVRAGPSIALRAAKAKPADPARYRELHNVFNEVCVSAGIMGNKPKLYVVDDPAPNAFATGLSRNDAHIAVTTGLLRSMPRYELRAVLAHEVAHVLNDDVRTVTIAVATAGVVALLADILARTLWVTGGGQRSGGRRSNSDSNAGGAQIILLVVGLVAVILAPIAAQLIRFAVSRQREYLADATAADLLRDPQSMVNALRRLEGDTTTLRRFEAATAHLWIEEPNRTEGKGREANLARRFATHPSITDRITRLAALNAGTVRLDAPLPPRADATPPNAPPPPDAPQPGAQSWPLPGWPPPGGGLPGGFPGGTWPPPGSGGIPPPPPGAG